MFKFVIYYIFFPHVHASQVTLNIYAYKTSDNLAQAVGSSTLPRIKFLQPELQVSTEKFHYIRYSTVSNWHEQNCHRLLHKAALVQLLCETLWTLP